MTLDQFNKWLKENTLAEVYLGLALVETIRERLSTNSGDREGLRIIIDPTVPRGGLYTCETLKKRREREFIERAKSCH